MGFVKFLGTAGARYVVGKQLRYSAGTWIELAGTRLLLDPGPGTLLRCRRSRPPLDPEALDGLILTHKHLDHSTDVNVMLEVMAELGHKGKKGTLMAPRDCLEGGDPVVLRYVRRYPERIEIMEEGKAVEIQTVRITPVRHRHGDAETYGVILESPEGQLGFVVDTRFFPELLERYSGCDLLVLNVVRREPTPEIDHLSLPEATEIIREARPKLAVITHFGMTMLRAKPHELARKITEEMGIEVIAADDGLTIQADRWRR
jgi:ribonuclease BN (tRNA processing enzyme)